MRRRERKSLKGVDARVVAAGALAVLTLLTACTSGSEGNASNASASTKSGGTLVWAKSLDVSSMDPSVSANAADWELYNEVYDTLVNVDTTGKLVPGLASAWTQPSPTTYLLDIRKGVRFSNGRAMTADDVAGTLERIASPKLASYWASKLGVKSAVAVGTSQVKVTLSTPRIAFLAGLAGPMAAILPMKELDAGTFDPTKEFLGTGPFMVKTHIKDQIWTMVRNPHYWGTPAKAARLDVKIVSDDAARIAALRDGSVAVSTFDSPDSMTLLKGQSNVATTVQEANSYYRLDVNAKTSLFSDPRLRQALALSIDRKQIADVAFGGVGQPTAAIVPNFNVCSATGVPFSNTDLGEAKRLVSAAGANGKTVNIMTTSGYKTFGPIAQVLQQNLQAIGFKVKIVQLDTGTWISRVFAKNAKFDVSISFSDNYGESSMVLNDYDPTVAFFNAGYVVPDPALSALIVKANSEPVGAGRNDIEKQACNTIAQNANMIPLITKPFVIAYRKDKITAKIASLVPYTVPLSNISTFSVK